MKENFTNAMNTIEKVLESVDPAIREAALTPLQSLQSDWEAGLSRAEAIFGRNNACS